jgi:hypothetical protein
VIASAVPDIDLFNFFRWSLGTVVTIYATLVTMQWAVGWYKYLSQPGIGMTILSRYIVIHGLRLRLVDFLGDFLICILLCVAFALLLQAHWVLSEVESTLSHVRAITRQLHLPAH